MSSSSPPDDDPPQSLPPGPRCKYLVETDSTEIQEETEEECLPFFVNLSTLPPSQLDHLHQSGLLSRGGKINLLRKRHQSYLNRPLLQTLSTSFCSLDASRPWILYWTLHGLDVLEELPPNDVLTKIVYTLRECFSTQENHGGGFGGGPMQMPHCAPTYASVMALCIIAGSNKEKASKMAFQFLQEIRQDLYTWFLTLQQGDGGFCMHQDGEIDVRASYCVVACAALLNILHKDLVANTAQHILSCQTYEGGFGGECWNEAHGGYTFCAVAALALLNQLHFADVPSLRNWLAGRQMACEGGFCGRTNKLVDGCYSFWQGGAMAIVSHYKQGMENLYHPSKDIWLQQQQQQDNDNGLLLDQAMLQRYILLCAQDLNGGLRDKPSKPRDFYHSCYNLSGLSASQHLGSLEYGDEETTSVRNTHVCFNVCMDRVKKVVEHFYNENETDEFITEGEQYGDGKEESDRGSSS